MIGSTASFGSLYNGPRPGGVVSAPTQQQVNAAPSRQSSGVQTMLGLTGTAVEGVTGLELPTLIALGGIALLLIYLD